jgi:hypothetical protein
MLGFLQLTTSIKKEVDDLTKAGQKPFEITEIGPFFSNTLAFAIVIGLLMAFGYLIWGGIDWIMSEGDKQKNESARNKITAALAGFAILALVWLVWRIILYALGIGEDTGTGIILKLPKLIR